MLYSVSYGEGAAHVRDGLPEDRRALLERGLRKLADDPRPEVSLPLSKDGNTRSVALSENIAIEYVISEGLLIVLMIRVVDTSWALLENEE
ncbi:hypothetical protein ADK70_08840 [Streptomyces rimosus subsp. pseudoverticillatus]|uniref:hypothetical protein n=1 Tax=Streptomyces rimosus TaxID=1927 RepID=UPI0006B273E8|nr:hypothetical protein [Streptomyces rimosus]KOT97126.1 hypothetical protein ADK70_08840 [Streptomyces rimosus subsp. pseudoverticillatus]